MRYCFLWDIVTYEILLSMRYCSLEGIATCKILLLARYCYLQDIATCKKWLPVRYRYLWDIAFDALWLPVRYACLQNITYTWMPFQVICNIDSQRDMTLYGYQPPIQLYCLIVRYTQILLMGYYYKRDNRYWYLWDICACNILTISGCLFPVILPIWRYWLPTRYGYSVAGKLIAGCYSTQLVLLFFYCEGAVGIRSLQ